jgi:hypothetical protein
MLKQHPTHPSPFLDNISILNPCIKFIICSKLLLVLGLVIVVPELACLECPLLAPPAPLASEMKMGISPGGVVGKVMGTSQPIGTGTGPNIKFVRLSELGKSVPPAENPRAVGVGEGVISALIDRSLPLTSEASTLP